MQAVLPVSFAPDGCDSGNRGNNTNMELDHFDDTGCVEKRKGGTEGNVRGEKDQGRKIRRHVCELCYKRFTQSGALKTHMLTHTGDKPFVCVLCGKAFSLACNLKRHELLHTGEKPFLCDICSKAFTRASHLKGHKRIHTGERPYKCPHCEADFNQSNHVRKHIKKVHTGSSHCDSEVTFPTFDDLERQKRIQSGGKPYVCAESGGGWSSQSSHPVNQSLNHTGIEERLPSATVTSPQTTVQTAQEPTGGGLGESGQNREKGKEEVLFSFIKRKPANYVTLQLPKQDEIIYCEDCDRESQGDCPQHRHFQVQSSGVSSVSAAPLCDPSCPDPTSPDLSRSLLTLDRGHVCRRCSASFIMFNSLKLHTLCIHGEKLLTALPPLSPPPIPIPAAPEDGGTDDLDSANVALNRFGDRRGSSAERRKSEVADKDPGKDAGDERKKRKTYRKTCDVCFKSFTDLRTHKLTHTGYKQFHCSLCSKSFTHACNLKAHELTHTGQKPFVCDVCGKAFTRDCHLKAHRRIHTGERPYKCPHCQADFNQSNHVQKHIRTVHSGESRRFVCQVCGGTFSRTTDLYKHRRVHFGKKRPRLSPLPP